jgi:hypothetical protein
MAAHCFCGFVLLRAFIVRHGSAAGAHVLAAEFAFIAVRISPNLSLACLSRTRALKENLREGR